MRFFYILFLILFYFNNLDAEDLSIDDLIDDVEKKTDLSQKTKLQNGGVSFIYTRDDIDRMQARNLKDILKSMYPFKYAENRLGLPDPLTYGTSLPFISSNIRIFIDNQEIVGGIIGSGIATYGDIDIGFVDHIEIYSQNPTYEYSTEPTYVLVKLYTKTAKRDNGGKVTLGTDNYGSALVNIYHADKIKDWSYFAFASFNDNNREKYYSHAQELSKDSQTSFFLATLKKDKHNILLTGKYQDRDTFAGKSLDASPTDSTLENRYFHIGYDGTIDNFSYLLAYDYISGNSVTTDDIDAMSSPSYINLKSISHTFSSELKYKFNTNSNKLALGVKFRLKKYSFPTKNVNGIDMAELSPDKQSIVTAFIEDSYSLAQNSILTLGISGSKVQNNHSQQDDDIPMIRLGHTYTNENWIIKTIGSYFEMTLDPYLLKNPIFLAYPNTKYETQKQHTFMEDIIYEKENNKYELLFGYTLVKDYLVPNFRNFARLETYDYIELSGFNLRWTHHYRRYDSLFIDVGITDIANLPYDISPKRLKQYNAVVRNLNTFGKFDIFNEIIYFKNNLERVSYVDYSAGIKYNHSKDFSISLKGQNILNKSKELFINRIDTTSPTFNPTNPTNWTLDTPLKVQSIDRKVLFNLEYLF
jgi:iron complex outermembrane receptor protein